MNYSERRNVFYRLISVGLILISLGLDTYGLYYVFSYNAEDKILSMIGLILLMAFTVLEIAVILMGWKKDSNLLKIAFNENGRVNNVPLIAISVGAVAGLALLILSLVVYFTRPEIDTKNAMLIIMVISTYLLVNCAIYYLFLLFFRKRNLTIKELIG